MPNHAVAIFTYRKSRQVFILMILNTYMTKYLLARETPFVNLLELPVLSQRLRNLMKLSP